MRRFHTLIFALAALLAAVVGAAPEAAIQRPSRIVAIGDIHGSFDGFVSILKATGLIDGSNRWSGGQTHLIQTGDYMDRGEGQRAVMDLLMSLEQQADDAGGGALALLGNHEVMNLVRETRDVTREIFATFAGPDSEKRRVQAWENYAKLAAHKKDKGEPVPSVYAQTRQAWMTTHPPGFVEYMEAMGPRGKYGEWLRGKPMVVNVDGNIFMHAGIPPDKTPATLDELNAQLRMEIQRLDKFVAQLIDRKLATAEFTLNEILQVASSEIGLANAVIAAAKAEGKEADRRRINVPLLMEAQEVLKIDGWLAIDNDGALWYRGLATVKDDASGEPFASVLKKLGARRFVTGHTPQPNRSITVRFGGRAILIDTGMLASVYKGRPSALEIAGDTLTAYYTDGKTELR
ncbi:MAG TPA: metallophosphoesterase [Vicinamibacterales bacterium]|nr:metallophosphoesterase [Vicinamibacterales bacterium]